MAINRFFCNIQRQKAVVRVTLKRILVFLSCALALFAHPVTEKVWEESRVFYDYLAENGIDPLILHDLDDETFGSLKTILAKTPFYEQRDKDSGRLLHALIPIGEDRQISLYDKKGSYRIEIVPTRYAVVTEKLNAKIQNSLQQDLLQIVGNSRLSMELTAIYETRVDFRRDLQKNDRVAAIYERKIRMGRTWGAITVKAAFIEMRKRRIYAVYRAEDGSYYDDRGETLANLFLKYPLQFTKITSDYQPNGRVHPILGALRPHLGVDFGAPKGTPVVSVADGTVRFRGCQKSCDQGYGNIVIVEHRNGWETRYAHLNGFASGVSSGSRVRQGQTIGYVGQTGIATGMHLHFEVRKSGETTNPLSLRNARQNELSGEELKKFLADVKEAQNLLDYMADVSENSVSRLSSVSRSSNPIN